MLMLIIGIIVFEQLEKLMMLMSVTTCNLDQPNVVKLVEVVDDPKEVCAGAENMGSQL